MAGKIGVLALQGAFDKHQQILDSLGTPSIEVRYPKDLLQCIGLIIPGGESTTLLCQIERMQFESSLRTFAKRAPIFGTCAGLILMTHYKLLDISVKRNGYGRQLHSFSTHLKLNLFPPTTIEAFFIRAPQITAIHSKNVTPLAENEGLAVCVQQGMHLAATFHPELTNTSAIHKHFIEICKAKQTQVHLSQTTPTKSFPMT